MQLPKAAVNQIQAENKLQAFNTEIISYWSKVYRVGINSPIMKIIKSMLDIYFFNHLLPFKELLPSYLQESPMACMVVKISQSSLLSSLSIKP